MSTPKSQCCNCTHINITTKEIATYRLGLPLKTKPKCNKQYYNHYLVPPNLIFDTHNCEGFKQNGQI